jgi:hypothetical protein
MEWLAADAPQPVLGAAVGTMAGVLMVAALLLQARIARYRGTVSAVFMADARSVLRVLGVIFAVQSIAIAFGAEGLARPLWLVLAVLGAALALGLLASRWRSLPVERAGRPRRLTPTGVPERSVASTAWEIGALVGGALGMLTYLATADHPFGHSPHWTLAVLGMLLGYAVGIAWGTPRFRFQSSVPHR